VSEPSPGTAAAALPPRYDPKAVERPTYARWLDAGAFRGRADGSAPPFVVVIPPPNVTGSLHLGHALNNTLQDVLVRFERMRGKDAIWIPGVDHAGLYTQVVVEQEIKQEGLTRHDLGREKFLERVWAWKERFGGRIVDQLKLMGCSCDWDRQRFTLDDGFVRATREHFIRLYREGLVYRGERITNWCPRCRTALSDLEVRHRERQGSLWHLRYPLKGGGEIVLATTRPETLVGDTAVAVHPEDERYAGLPGRTAILPLLNREIPVVADGVVDRTFGTGAVKITPGHDPNDFEVGRRHALPVVNIFNPDATLNERAGPYAGLDRFEARDRIVADLEAAGLLVKVEPHVSPVGHCDRCGTVLEPMVTKQWYLKTRGLADRAVEAVTSGEVRFVPDHMHAVFFDWMGKITDWCISRQTWWGHRIPVWRCTACGRDDVPASGDAPDPSRCAACGGALEQDPDTLDTWFTSCLWPFGVQGWPGEAFDRAVKAGTYPTTVLVTGWDILFFWVARMIMMGLHHTGRVPFRTVVFNSLVADPEGKKMSKSKGNVVDPLELFDRYGTDAVRFTLCSLETLRQSFRLAPDRVEHARNFMNKIWNAARFALGELGSTPPPASPPEGRSAADRWILSRTQDVIAEATASLERYAFNEYAALLERFFWHEVCDVYLELAKPALKDPARRDAVRWTLHRVFDSFLRLLHPAAPFITEALWQRLPRREAGDAPLMVQSWPAAEPALRDAEAADAIGICVNAVGAIRTIKHEAGLAGAGDVAATVHLERQETADRLEPILRSDEFRRLAGVASLVVSGGTATSAAQGPGTPSGPRPQVTSVIPGGLVRVFLPAPADPKAEKARLLKEQDQIQALLSRTRAALTNEDYLAKAPPELVEESRTKAAEYEARLTRLAERLRQL
jgi:valyl-tRNA synthetase